MEPQIDLRSVFETLANEGTTLMERMLSVATKPDAEKRLRTFGIEKAAKMAKCSSNHIRDLEAKGKIPSPATTDPTGRGKRTRTYTLSDINRIRDEIKTRPRRPNGAAGIVVSVSNMKGGVAKTSTSVHLAQFLALEGYRTLLIDLDPQASATQAFGYLADLMLEEENTVSPALLDDPSIITKPLDQGGLIRQTYWAGLDLIPAQLGLQNVDFMLPTAEINPALGAKQDRLKNALRLIKDRYDVIVLDSPPSLGMLSFNSVVAADLLLIPVPPAMYELSSSIQFFRTLEQLFAQVTNADVQRVRIMITKHDGHVQSGETEGFIRQIYGPYVLTSRMMQTDELQKASGDLISVYEIDKPRGSSDTYNRAITLLDEVNSEILKNIQEMWKEQVKRIEQNTKVAV